MIFFWSHNKTLLDSLFRLLRRLTSLWATVSPHPFFFFFFCSDTSYFLIKAQTTLHSGSMSTRTGLREPRGCFCQCGVALGLGQLRYLVAEPPVRMGRRKERGCSQAPLGPAKTAQGVKSVASWVGTRRCSAQGICSATCV